MCGIVALVGKPGLSYETWIKPMTNVIAHRGPDDEGFEIFPNGAFGHRRLSIIDLTKTGHQAMVTEDGRYWIIHNGEVYNYIEIRKELCEEMCSTSDTEVILKDVKKPFWPVGGKTL